MKTSAGLLVHRSRGGRIEVFLVHPGGPFWRKRDAHAWSIPKGEIDGDDDPLPVALREFREETGQDPPAGAPVALDPVRQSGKRILAFAVEGDPAAGVVASNTVAVEWPPRSGRTIRVPEVDRAAWFDLTTARGKIHKGQAPLIDQLTRRLAAAR